MKILFLLPIIIFSFDQASIYHQSIHQPTTSMGISYCTIEPVDTPPPVGDHIAAKMNGFVSKDFEAGEDTDGWRRSFFGWPWKKPANVPWNHIFSGFTQTEVKMHNARILQENSNLTKAEFFEKHGFVLVRAPTKVTNWNEDYENDDNDITNIYHKEIEDVLRNEVYPPGTKFTAIDQDNAVLKRGPQSKNNFYGSGVHQDYCLTSDHYLESIQCYDNGESFEKESKQFKDNLSDSEIFAVICFWRPVEMKEPLIHNPLCVLDCNSVEKKDILKTKIYGFTPTGMPHPQLTLKHNDNQRWCYYPDMTDEEVLVFKQMYVKKSDPNNDGEYYKACFHSAFADPRQSYFSKQSRKSTEHRVRVFLKE